MIISAILVNNILLAQFLGTCPFIGVSNKISTALGMAIAVVFVMTLATLVTSTINKYFLVQLDITFLQTITYILVIAALVQMVEMILKKISPPLYQALGVYLPLITTNCAVLGVALLVTKNNMSIIDGTLYTMFTAIGFGVAILIFAGIREQLNLVKIPKGMQGVPLALVLAGILAMAFMGFANMVKM
jgi:Na+-translocating ferredoxin:NAD+ oxidoreductase subunit A